MKKISFLVFLTVFVMATAGLRAGDMAGIKVIDLNRDEASALGITIGKGTVEFIDTRQPDNSRAVKPKKVIVYPDRFDFKNLKKSESKILPAVSPRLAVTKTSTGSAAYFSLIKDFNESQYNKPDIMAEQASQLNKLVAVHIRPEESGNEVWLWYEPGQAFTEALPDRFKTDIEQEIIGGASDAGDTRTDTYFTRSSTDLFAGLTVFPNPAGGDRANISFSLSEGRTFSIIIYDINGNPVKNVQENVYIQGGQYKAQLELDTLPSGMYIVSIMTDRGERATQRIIVI